MKILISCLAFLAAFTSSAQAAGAKLESRKMTCREVSGIIDERGSATIYYSRNHFEKFYANNAYCEERQSIPAYLPTRDNPSCFVGFVCQSLSLTRAENGSGGISVIGASAPFEGDHPSSGR